MNIFSNFMEQFVLWMESLGYIGIMVGLMIEVIPSEIVLAYGGFLVAKGEINFVGAVLFGTIGGVIAQLFVYWIGRYGGRPILQRYGKYLLISDTHIDRAEHWFYQYGTGVVFTARFIPVVRHAISIPAGIAKMNIMKFTFLTTLATIPWSIFFIYLGKTLGEQWKNIKQVASPYVLPIVLISLVVCMAYVTMKALKCKKKR